MKAISLLFVLILLSFIFSCKQKTKDSSSIGYSKATIMGSGGFVPINYISTGQGDTTLLFVHGWALNEGYWSNQLAHFKDNYNVVAIDLPGFGKSGKDRNDWSTEAYGRDVDSVISQLRLKNVILVGHSMAGDIVLQAAINNPNVIGIVGVDNFKNAGIPESPQAKKEFAGAIAQMKKNFKVVAFMYFNQALFSKTTDTDIKQRILNDVAHADTTIAVAIMEQGNDFDEAAKLHQSKLKLYLINSDYQPTDTSGLVKNKLPYMLLTVHGTGHFPMVEDPKDFNIQLEKVLADK